MDFIRGPSANKFTAERMSGLTENTNCEILISEIDGKALKKILTEHNKKIFITMSESITDDIKKMVFTTEAAKEFFKNLKTLQQQYENDISGDITLDPNIECVLFENNNYNDYKIIKIKKSSSPRDTVIVSKTIDGKLITKLVKFDKICIKTPVIETAIAVHKKAEQDKSAAKQAVEQAKSAAKQAAVVAATQIADTLKAQKDATKKRDDVAKTAAKEIADAAKPQKPFFTGLFKPKTPAATATATPVAVGGGKKRHSHRHHQKHNIKSSDISICE